MRRRRRRRRLLGDGKLLGVLGAVAELVSHRLGVGLGASASPHHSPSNVAGLLALEALLRGLVPGSEAVTGQVVLAVAAARAV
jgi:hypothetical protein